jgi:hypothetical protein
MDNVTPAARQRDTDQQIVGVSVGLMHRPDAVAARHRPVDLDVAEHVLLLERRAFERQPEALAHRVVRSVGADEVGRPQRLFSFGAGESDGHAVGILLKAADVNAALHMHAVHRELVAQDCLGGVLRNRDEAERDVVR